MWALKGGSVPHGHSAIGIDDLESSPGRQLVEQRIFQITPDGAIETLVEFDREQVSMYLLNVAVRDNGSQPLATSATLLVLILDENDNAPVWTFPAESARQINITTGNPPGALVARLQVRSNFFAFLIPLSQWKRFGLPRGQHMIPVPPTFQLPRRYCMHQSCIILLLHSVGVFSIMFFSTNVH